MIDKTITNPGFHRQFNLSRFNGEERRILEKLSQDWYMTNSGEEIYIAQSKYNYFLMKPSQRTSEMFNIEREIVCVLSDYETLSRVHLIFSMRYIEGFLSFVQKACAGFYFLEL